jgi:hypothetical protein
MENFKAGDWIIATKPMMVEGGVFTLAKTMVPDWAYMHRPIKVFAVSEHHIVYESDTISGGKLKNILPVCELKDRGFIIAPPILVEAIET